MKNRLLVLLTWKSFFAIFFISFLNFEIVFCQIQYNESELWSKEPFSTFQISDEDISLRTEYSKHFRNSNGKITAVISAGPVHYMENGKLFTTQLFPMEMVLKTPLIVLKLTIQVKQMVL